MVIGTPTVLNLIPGGVMKVIHVNQVNENIEIQFRIMNGAQPFNVPEGVSCTIRGTKGDNFGYAAAVAVTAGSNIVTVTLTEQLTAVAGAGNIFELVFVGASDDMKVSTENFLLDVERAALGEDTVISDSDLAYADQVLDQLQSVGAVNAQVQQNKANIAAEITRATAAEQTLQQNINAEAAARQAADNTLQSNINAEASSRATTDASLQSQINQLVAPSGEAPSAAEVENARIGSDGTVYSTLGDAIRTQNSLLKSAFNHVTESTNLFGNTAGEIYEMTIVYNSGAILSNSGSRVVCVPCKPNTEYLVKKNAGGRFVVGDLPATPVAGNTCTKYYADNTASEIYFTTSSSAKYLVAFVWYNSTDGLDYSSMLVSVVVNEVSAVDHIARTTTQKVENGYSVYDYNNDISLLTSSGSGRYIIGHAFPAGYIDSVFVDAAASSEIEVRLYTLDSGTLNVAFYTTGTSVSAGMLEIPVKKNALNPFYIMINRVSGGIMYRSNSAYDIYGVSAAESYTLASLTASHYEFGISVKYGLFRDYSPLGKNYLLIGDSYLEGYSADGNVVSWGERLKSYMGLEYNTVIKYKGGIGFIEGTGALEGYSFKSLALSASIPDPNTITHIVVCGGYNDAVRSLSLGEAGILNAIEDFYDNVSPVYPNANIYIGMIGYRNNDDAVLSRIRGAGLSAYQTGNRYGANEKIRYLNNVEWTLDSDDMSSDGYHPNAVGQVKLAYNIKNALITGSAPIRSFARDSA